MAKTTGFEGETALFIVAEPCAGKARELSTVPAKSSRGRRALVACALAAGASVPATALGATFAVTNTNGSGPGSLADAILATNLDTNPDVIDFDAGVTGAISLANQLSVTGSVSINGPGSNNLIISTGNNGRVFYIYNDAADLDVTISGVTLADSSVAGVGGCILDIGESLTLSGVTLNFCSSTLDGGGLWVDGQDNANLQLNIQNSIITHATSSAGNGAGVFASNFGGTALIDGSTITNGAAGYNGGGASFSVADGGSLTITGSTIAQNGAMTGAGLLLTSAVNASALIEDTTIAENHATGGGGGISATSFEALQIVGSTVSGNTSNNAGGGVSASMGVVVAENSTFSGNSSNSTGGALFFDNSDSTLRHCTVTDNTSVDSGAVRAGVQSAITIENTILANSTVSAGGDIGVGTNSSFTLSDSLLEADGGTAFTDGGNNITGQDPDLGPLQNNYGPTQTHLPNVGSVVIDAGDPAFVAPPDTDQRGLPRKTGANIDIGAVEVIQYANGEAVPGGTCTAELGTMLCQSGFCSTESNKCIPNGGCADDVDCAVDDVCNLGTFLCEPGAGGAGGTGATGAAGDTGMAGDTGAAGAPVAVGGETGAGGDTGTTGNGGTSINGGTTGTGGTGGGAGTPGSGAAKSEHEGGCGCEVPGNPINSNSALAGLLYAAAAIGRRRRR